MVAWAMNAGGAATFEWFSLRFARARALLPGADFDTIIPMEFAESITCELVDVVGAATADAVDFYSGGVVALNVGDNVETESHGRLQLTGSPSHVGGNKSWYAASLVRVIRPPADETGDTLIEALGLYSSDANRVAIGIFNGSGGSITNWIGSAIKDSSATTVLGPALDPQEAPVWHLFEALFDADGGTLSFWIDGQPFDDTIAAAAVPGQALRFSSVGHRDDVGDAVVANFDKAAIVVASPRVGEAE